MSDDDHDDHEAYLARQRDHEEGQLRAEVARLTSELSDARTAHNAYALEQAKEVARLTAALAERTRERDGAVLERNKAWSDRDARAAERDRLREALTAIVEDAPFCGNGFVAQAGSSRPASTPIERARLHASRALATAPSPETTCPSAECPMCSGAACMLCGAGTRTRVDEPRCEHDVIERHTSAPSPDKRDAVVEAGDELQKAVNARRCLVPCPCKDTSPDLDYPALVQKIHDAERRIDRALIAIAALDKEG